MKSALVTGGTGFVGSHLVELLLKKGYKVRCLVRKSSSLTWLQDLPVELVYGDLFSQDALRNAVRDVDYIYHVAGVVAAKNRQGYFRGNQEGTRNLLEACLAVNKNLKKFIFVSSMAALGPGVNSEPVTEETPPHPLTAYGESKKAAEDEVRKYWDKIPAVIVRPPAVYGPRDTGVLTFFQSINKGIQPLIGFDEKTISLVHSYDLVQGILLAGENDTAIRTSYCLGSEKFYTWDEIGSITGRVMNKRVLKIKIPHTCVFIIAGITGFLGKFGKKPPILNFEKGIDITRENWTCSIEKARKELGYNPCISFEEGVRITAAWYKEKGWL